jgi:hypothetical protein
LLSIIDYPRRHSGRSYCLICVEYKFIALLAAAGVALSAEGLGGKAALSPYRPGFQQGHPNEEF